MSKPWNGHEDLKLLRYKGQGWSFKQVSKVMKGRSRQSCERRYERLVSNGKVRPQTDQMGRRVQKQYDPNKEFLSLLHRHHGEQMKRNAEEYDDGMLRS